MIKRIAVIFLILAVLPAIAYSSNRGLDIVSFKDRAGNEVGLYKESHALIIGVSQYTAGWPLLPGVKKDVKLVKAALEKQGFHVVTVMDPDLNEMRTAFNDFIFEYGDEKDNRLLFYFAGHGVQTRGVNYFIPLGADIEDEADLDVEAVSAADILSQMDSAGNALNLVILDACRNNPFKGKMRSASRGLARVEAASGSLVAFAAAPGQVAEDGKDGNSPYTKALVKAMQVPGLAVEQMFKRVRIAVERDTGGAQTPWEESSLRGDFFFAGRGASATAPALAAQPAPVSAVAEA